MPVPPRTQSTDELEYPNLTGLQRPKSAGFSRSRSITQGATFFNTVWHGIRDQSMKSVLSSSEIPLQTDDKKALSKPTPVPGTLKAYGSDPIIGVKKEGAPRSSNLKTASGQEHVPVENPVIGVLSKWVNLGRGWGPRLFVLDKVSDCVYTIVIAGQAKQTHSRLL